MTAQNPYLFKILLLGDIGVGKTSIAQFYVSNTFKDYYKSTIGVDILSKKLSLLSSDNTLKYFELQIYDFSGHSYFKKMRSSLSQSSQGALLICSITDKKSFQSLPQWIADTKEGTGSIPYVLICNKIDLKTKTTITEAEITHFATEYQMPFVWASAKTGMGIEEAFGKITALMAEKMGYI